METGTRVEEMQDCLVGECKMPRYYGNFQNDLLIDEGRNMDRKISECSKRHSTVVEFGEKFIQQVLDGNIGIFFDIYEIDVKATRSFERKVQSIQDILADKSLDIT